MTLAILSRGQLANPVGPCASVEVLNEVRKKCWHIRIYQCLSQCYCDDTVLLVLQESLANTKVSVRHPWYIGCNSWKCPSLMNAKQYQHHLYIVEKYFQVAGTAGLSSFV